ncbi:MAG: penicillin-binding protein activator LpoB [Bacteroidales bacterium]|nr:penicillin-binding protein activator LpoB [Bacteroidales bacterium]
MNYKTFIIFLLVFSSILNCHSQYHLLVFDFNIESDQLTKNDGKVIANSIRTELTKYVNSSEIDVLEREEMVKLLNQVLEDQKIDTLFDDTTAIRLGKMYHFNYAILGKLQTSNLFEGIKVSTRLVNLEKNTIEGAVELKFNKSQYDSIVSTITRHLLMALNINLNSEKKPIDIDTVQFINKNQIGKYKYKKSKRIEDVLNNYKGLISNLYIRPNLPNENYWNAKTYHQINSQSEIIAMIDCYNSKNSIGIVINEEGIYCRFYDCDFIPYFYFEEEIDTLSPEVVLEGYAAFFGEYDTIKEFYITNKVLKLAKIEFIKSEYEENKIKLSCTKSSISWECNKINDSFDCILHDISMETFYYLLIDIQNALKNKS